jgi:hypothetical protein
MSVKGVVVWLNSHGYRTRRAAGGGIGPLRKLLTNPVYKGEAHFNRTDSKTRAAKPATEHVVVPVDPVIDRLSSMQCRCSSRRATQRSRRRVW